MNRGEPCLSDLRLAPPPIDRFVRPPGQSHLEVPLGLAKSTARASLPFFWHDPPWHLAKPQHARAVAGAVAGGGVTIGMAERDLGEDETVTSAGVEGNRGKGNGEDGRAGAESWSRMAIQRPDRAGWTFDDCVSSRVIEIRLGQHRSVGVGCRYEPERYARWHPVSVTGPDGPLTPIPLWFPPEWSGLPMLGSQVAQLRSLSDAAIYVSCDESHVDRVLPAVLDGEADGILVRFHDDPVALLWRCRQILAAKPEPHPRVWISGPALEIEDMVKCFALGASAVAIDAWCDGWLTGTEYARLFPTGAGSFPMEALVGKTQQQRFVESIRNQIDVWRESLSGVLQRVGVAEIDQLGEEHLVRAGGGWAS